MTPKHSYTTYAIAQVGIIIALAYFQSDWGVALGTLLLVFVVGLEYVSNKETDPAKR